MAKMKVRPIKKPLSKKGGVVAGRAMKKGRDKKKQGGPVQFDGCRRLAKSRRSNRKAVVDEAQRDRIRAFVQSKTVSIKVSVVTVSVTEDDTDGSEAGFSGRLNTRDVEACIAQDKIIGDNGHPGRSE